MFKRFILLYLAFCIALAPAFTFATANNGAWSQTDIIRQGATSVYNATKQIGDKTYKAVATITPNVKQVAGQIAKVGAVGAVTTAVDMLLNGVDWVMKAENNSVIFETVDNTYCSYSWGKDVCVSSLEQAEREFKARLLSHEKFEHCRIDVNGNYTCRYTGGYVAYGQVTFYNTGAKRRVNAEQVATVVLDNANKDDDTAKRFVATVADSVVTQQDKEEQWERTKAPAVPATGTDTANPAKDETSTQNPPDTANPDKPSDKPFELPTFCGWAKTVCDFIDWAKQEPDIPKKDKDIDLQVEQKDMIDPSNFDQDYLVYGGQCPTFNGFTISIGSQSVNLSFDITPLCDFAIAVRPAVIALAYLAGMGIVANAIREI